jgi:4,5-DOPA dioxygenase extradiol
MLAIRPDKFTAKWEKIATSIPKPKSIIVISAHFETNGTFVTGNENQRTIYDFGGFPQELRDIKYEPPGSPELATKIMHLLKEEGAQITNSWGLDHGAWSVLKYFYPKADISVVALSVDSKKPPIYHYNIGRKLNSLRYEGVLIIGTGNIVHNLGYAQTNAEPPHDFALTFNDAITNLLLKNKYMEILSYENLHGAKLAADDHILLLFYILGAQDENEKIEIFNNEIVLRAVSMLGIIIK